MPAYGPELVCCETAIHPKSGAKRKRLARAQNVADDPTRKSGMHRSNQDNERLQPVFGALAGLECWSTAGPFD